MKLKVYKGDWVYRNGRCYEDETCKKINDMVEKELSLIGDIDGWDLLYYDAKKSIYWELIYPQSEMHGGGPPQLSEVTFEYAQKKYGITLKQQEELRNKNQFKQKI